MTIRPQPCTMDQGQFHRVKQYVTYSTRFWLDILSSPIPILAMLGQEMLRNTTHCLKYCCEMLTTSAWGQSPKRYCCCCHIRHILRKVKETKVNSSIRRQWLVKFIKKIIFSASFIHHDNSNYIKWRYFFFVWPRRLEFVRSFLDQTTPCGDGPSKNIVIQANLILCPSEKWQSYFNMSSLMHCIY